MFLPFAFAIDQKDNIWVTNILGSHVTRFSGGDPTKAETFKTGFSGSGLAVDSLGNVWVTNKLGNSERGRVKMLEMAVAGKVNYDGEPDATSRLTRVMVEAMYTQKPGWEGGSLTVLGPDGSEANFSPVYGKGITGPWAVSVDGNDNIWISNFSSAYSRDRATLRLPHRELPARHEDRRCNLAPWRLRRRRFAVAGGHRCRPGRRRLGDQQLAGHRGVLRQARSRPLQPAAAGQGVVVFFGMAKPVKTPLIGPARRLYSSERPWLHCIPGKLLDAAFNDSNFSGENKTRYRRRENENMIKSTRDGTSSRGTVPEKSCAPGYI